MESQAAPRRGAVEDVIDLYGVRVLAFGERITEKSISVTIREWRLGERLPTKVGGRMAFTRLVWLVDHVSDAEEVAPTRAPGWG